MSANRTLVELIENGMEAEERNLADVRQHLAERMRDRAISIADLNQLRLWIESQPGRTLQ